MKLTSQNVNDTVMYCLYKENEDSSNMVKAEGVMHTFGFNPDRLNERKQDIFDMLNELPDEFKSNSGDGWSFLQACLTKNGEHWGEHRDIDRLICLGIAVGAVKFQLPRSLWAAFPGNMPYFVIYENL